MSSFDTELERGSKPAEHTKGHIDCPVCEAARKAVVYRLDKNTLFSYAAKTWLRSRTLVESGTGKYIRKSTIRSYEQYIRALDLFFGELKLADITIGHLRSYQNARLVGSEPFIRKRHPNTSEEPRPLPASSRKVNQEMATLRLILKRANCWTSELDQHAEPLEEEVLDIPPALSMDQQQFWLDIAASTEEWKLVYWYSILAFETAMTTDEMRAIRLGDIDIVKRTIRIPNSVAHVRYRGRTIPIKSADGLWATEKLMDRARDLGASLPIHFLYPFRLTRKAFDPTRPMTVSGLKKRWEGVRKASGIIWFTPKDTRHTAITRWAESGVDPGLITMWAGPISTRWLNYYMQIASGGNQRRLKDVSKEVNSPAKQKNEYVMQMNQPSKPNESDAAKDDLQIGDVVSLKSGGPKMTVDNVRGNQAHCTWFTDGKREGNWFEAATINKEL
jgi:integrase/uncharacterized protein YodC (DUF2158 family)